MPLVFIDIGEVLSYSFSYNIVFDDGQEYWDANFEQLQSPARNSLDITKNRFPAVNSKYNQPRSSGTCPHRGVDFDMDYPQEIFSPDSGTVRRVYSHTISVEIAPNTYAAYKHVVPYVTVGQTVSPNEAIGRIGTSAENGGYPEHLHFGITKDKEQTVWEPVGPRYSSYPEWHYGMDLDFVGDGNLYSDNTFSIYA